MPLVYVGAEPIESPTSEAHGRARKVKREYTEGELVRIAGAGNQAEAELIQGLLLEEGIPSVLRRTRGFDVPDFLAAGPRDVLVPEAAVEAAREVLLATSARSGEEEGGGAGRSEKAERSPAHRTVVTPHAAKLVGVILAGGGAAALVAWALVRVAG
jgi:hypothetical protein